METDDIMSISGEPGWFPVEVKCESSGDTDEEINVEIQVEEINYEDKLLPTRFKCAECDQDFGNKSKLKTHIRSIHLKEQRFNCNDCEYKTNINESFVRHMRSHTNEKPFGCDNCEKMFSSHSSLSNHKRSVHLKNV